MIIIGISMSHDGTITVLKDGKNIFSIGEERLNRIKSYIGFPFKALEYIVQQGIIKPEAVDQIVIGTHAQFPASHKEMFAFCLNEDKIYYDFQNHDKPAGFYIGDQEWEKIKTDAECKAYVEGKLKSIFAAQGITAPISFADHHQCHATAAYYASGFKEALAITLDSYGDGLSATVTMCRNGNIERIHEEPYDHSLGSLYSEVTKACGFRISRHEGKITGLAAYGDPAKSEAYFDTCVQVKDGKIHIQLEKNDILSKLIRVSGNFISGIKDTRPERIIKELRHLSKEDLSAGVQRMLEKRAVEFISYWVQKTGIRNIVVSGGVFANVKANQRIAELKEVEEFFVYPDMGDGGNAYGGAVHYYFQHTKNSIPYSSLHDVYLGPAYSAEEIETELKKHPTIAYHKSNDVAEETGALVFDNKIVGWFQGAMEYGPRALGNRTILASPTDKTINKWLNDRLKRTEFMPFAPSCLYEYADELFLIPKESLKYAAMFMTITFDMKEEWVKKAPAVAHIDKTARPQLVTADSNPRYYAFLKAYHRLSGLPLVINTSFNVHEEPIVCSPLDGVKPLLSGVIDYLVIGDYVCKLKPAE
jgi:carbamoyltransferase